MVDIYEKLFPNIITLLVQWGATFILYLVFKKHLYQPVVNWLEKRAAKIQEELDHAKQKEELAVLEHQKAQQVYKSAVDESAELVSTSQSQALLEKELILKQARVEAENVFVKAKKDIENERQQMLRDVQEEIVDVALAASERLLQQEVSQAHQKEAVERFIAELRS